MVLAFKWLGSVAVIQIVIMQKKTGGHQILKVRGDKVFKVCVC